MVYETGANTGIFAGNVKFGADNSDSDKKTIRIKGNDNIFAVYTDERNANNKINTVITAVSSFQYSEARIQTSAVNDEGTGNMLEIIIDELDANNPYIQNRIIAKVGSGDSYDEIKLYLEETGINTGRFQCKLYFTENETSRRALQLSETDNINIRYIDVTTPAGDAKEIRKTIKWTFQRTTLKIDKESYMGYNSSAKILLINMDLNKDISKIDTVNVKANSLSSGDVRLELRETKADSGEFAGTLHFGKSSSSNEGIVKVNGQDTVTVLYTNNKDNTDFAECSAAWSPHNGQVTLDKHEYKGSNAPVKIKIVDWDIAENTDEKDKTYVIARVLGSPKYVRVDLAEVGRNSGTFAGTLYINGSGENSPYIRLNSGDKLEIVYRDEDTLSGIDEDRTVYAGWTE
jgi:hypothetical protein